MILPLSVQQSFILLDFFMFLYMFHAFDQQRDTVVMCLCHALLVNALSAINGEYVVVNMQLMSPEVAQEVTPPQCDLYHIRLCPNMWSHSLGNAIWEHVNPTHTKLQAKQVESHTPVSCLAAVGDGPDNMSTVAVRERQRSHTIQLFGATHSVCHATGCGDVRVCVNGRYVEVECLVDRYVRY